MKTEQEVLDYLHKHPQFLAKYAAKLNLPAKKTQVISFDMVEAADTARRLDAMKQQMVETVENIVANDIAMAKFLRLYIALMKTNTVRQCVQTLSGSLKDDFALPDFALKFINPPAAARVPAQWVFNEKKAVLAALEKVSAPLCSAHCVHAAAAAWLPEDSAESFLHLPVRAGGKMAAFLLIGHPDPAHFSEQTPTDYVATLAEALSATFTRVLKLRP